MCCYRSLVFNCCFQNINISQGCVATHLRCGGIRILSDSIITNLQMFSWFKLLNKFENRSMFDEVKAYVRCVIKAYKKCARFLGPSCMCQTFSERTNGRVRLSVQMEFDSMGLYASSIIMSLSQANRNRSKITFEWLCYRSSLYACFAAILWMINNDFQYQPRS